MTEVYCAPWSLVVHQARRYRHQGGLTSVMRGIGEGDRSAGKASMTTL